MSTTEDHTDLPSVEEIEALANSGSKKERQPSYDVERRLDDGAWFTLATDLTASSRRDAVVQATDSLSEDEQWGMFRVTLVSREAEGRIVNRQPRVESDWS